MAKTQKAALVSPKVLGTAVLTQDETGTVTGHVKIPKAGERYWQIKGTEIYARTKEELKDVRRSKNLEAATPEFTYEGEGDSKTRKATDANTWRFRVTKGPDHPARNA